MQGGKLKELHGTYPSLCDYSVRKVTVIIICKAPLTSQNIQYSLHRVAKKVQYYNLRGGLMS